MEFSVCSAPEERGAEMSNLGMQELAYFSPMDDSKVLNVKREDQRLVMKLRSLGEVMGGPNSKKFPKC